TLDALAQCLVVSDVRRPWHQVHQSMRHAVRFGRCAAVYPGDTAADPPRPSHELVAQHVASAPAPFGIHEVQQHPAGQAAGDAHPRRATPTHGVTIAAYLSDV